jgi:hypothetical protein
MAAVQRIEQGMAHAPAQVTPCLWCQADRIPANPAKNLVMPAAGIAKCYRIGAPVLHGRVDRFLRLAPMPLGGAHFTQKRYEPGFGPSGHGVTPEEDQLAIGAGSGWRLAAHGNDLHPGNSVVSKIDRDLSYHIHRKKYTHEAQQRQKMKAPWF